MGQSGRHAPDDVGMLEVGVHDVDAFVGSILASLIAAVGL